MKAIFVSIFLLGAMPAMVAGTAPAGIEHLQTRAKKLVYERKAADSNACVRVFNFTDARKGFMVTLGEKVVGYGDEGEFDIRTAPPALVAMLENAPGDSGSAHVDAGEWTAVAPISDERGYVMWNQDSPFNDLCPEYEIGKRAPTGCVATAMAQVMFYHKWPEKGTGSHTYSPAVLAGNTLTADFGNTEYRWDAMIPYYAPGLSATGFSEYESRAAVAELMLHCGVAVDMVYYSQSGATDYDVPPALVNYFGYDRGLAYRKREHYSTRDWLRVIHDELEAGRPVLAYGRSASGGHAYVFDGMDEQGFIHVNWGWGGMSNGYFNTSALTPPAQGIGGSDGGFNYSQRIITGIRPAASSVSDYHVEITSTEALSAAKQKIANGSDVKIKLTGKVYNHGWRDAEFDYALLLRDAGGNVVKVVEGPKGISLAMNQTDYAPDFGTVNFGMLASGEYTLYPCVRMAGGNGDWIPVRDEYIGYPNVLGVTVDDNGLSFHNSGYFNLVASETVVPEVIYSGVPALITTDITNNGDVEYHGEIKAVLFNGTNRVASTSNYIIDLAPGYSTSIRFTDSFTVQSGSYTMALVNDDGQKVSSPVVVEVKDAPELGDVFSDAELDIIKASREEMNVTAKVRSDKFFQGLLYAFIFNENGSVQTGCLYPEYVTLSDGQPVEVKLNGEFENGVPGKSYVIQLATYGINGYTFLNDENSIVTFKLGGSSAAELVEAEDESQYRYYDFNGFEVDPKETRYYKKVKTNK